jgi:hypothetical protein
MLSAKPTIRSNDTAALRALQQAHNYEVQPTATGWSVRNRISGEVYQVEVTGRCSCPHGRKINPSGGHCKHFSLCDLTERVTASRTSPCYQEDTREELHRLDSLKVARDARMVRDFGPDCF